MLSAEKAVRNVDKFTAHEIRPVRFKRCKLDKADDVRPFGRRK